MRKIVAGLALAVFAASMQAGAAAAKEVEKASLCGADGCTDLDRRAAQALAEGGPPMTPPRSEAPFYVVRISVAIDRGRSERFKVHYVPDANTIRFPDGTWMGVAPPARSPLRSLAAGKPFPARDLGPLLKADFAKGARTTAGSLPPEVVEAPPTHAAGDGGSDVPWLALGLGVAGAGALVPLVIALRRRFAAPGDGEAAGSA